MFEKTKNKQKRGRGWPNLKRKKGSKKQKQKINKKKELWRTRKTEEHRKIRRIGVVSIFFYIAAFYIKCQMNWFMKVEQTLKGQPEGAAAAALAVYGQPEAALGLYGQPEAAAAEALNGQPINGK